MKKFINITNIALILFSFTLFISCNGDDDSVSTPTAKAPSLTITESELDATFFTEGFASPFTVNWNGEPGSYRLGTSIEGVRVDANNGQISWNKKLPIGTHDVQIIAENSIGSATKTIQINNPLQGKFVGERVYLKNNDNFKVEIYLKPNGEATEFLFIENKRIERVGNWYINDDGLLHINLTNSDSGYEFSYLSDLKIGNNEVKYSSIFYVGHDAAVPFDDGNLVLTVNLEQ